MTFQALLVSKDDEAVAVLTPVLSGLGLPAVCCEHSEAINLLSEQKYDAVVVDCDHAEGAAPVLQELHQSASDNHSVTVALLSDKSKVRSLFGAGANFVLYKPVSPQQAEASLRAAAALIKRERRRGLRVPVQVPIQLKVQNGPPLEGILLDLSEDGMDVLAAQPLCPSAPIGAHFSLSDGKTEIDVCGEIAWANPNGQAGVRFVDLSEDLRTTLKTWVAANAPELPPPDPEPVTCKLTDMSAGGCYVETQSPFPERSGIALCLKAEGMEVQAEGTVRVMHPEFGMGIEFASGTAEERAQVTRFIEFLTHNPGTSPELLVTPRVLTASDNHHDSAAANAEDMEDPLLDLLGKHEALSQEEFLQQLHQQRGSAEAASA